MISSYRISFANRIEGSYFDKPWEPYEETIHSVTYMDPPPVLPQDDLFVVKDYFPEETKPTPDSDKPGYRYDPDPPPDRIPVPNMPEPGSLVLLGTALLIFAFVVRLSARSAPAASRLPLGSPSDPASKPR